jgi:hypothetical protein
LEEILHPERQSCESVEMRTIRSLTSGMMRKGRFVLSQKMKREHRSNNTEKWRSNLVRSCVHMTQKSFVIALFLQ